MHTCVLNSVSLRIVEGILRIYYENMNICINEWIQTCIFTCRHIPLCVEYLYPHKKEGYRLL